MEPVYPCRGRGGEAVLTVRHATVEDVDALAKIVTACWQLAYRSIIPAEQLEALSWEERAERFRGYWSEDRLILAAETERRVVGFARDAIAAGLPGYDAEIEALYVHPDNIRRGAGKLLVSEMVRRLYLPSGARNLCIHTLKGNVIGQSFYERLGGNLVAEDVWSWNGGSYDAVWYGFDDLEPLVISSS
ncbi:MAG TPA: GNAT family N-acetyltransferase [Fimbriimonadaceae bacterium]|nr:GNAT family N-acetyltransferase [Fimbriimonadaceae bacterium]